MSADRGAAIAPGGADATAAGAIAVVGMAGRFPGAPDLDAFWQSLGRESIRFFADEELLAAGVEPELVRHPSYVKARGVLDDVESFDAAFFGFTAAAAELMDPQQRLFLECAWQALEDAGYDPGRTPGPVGVYGGASLSTYLLSNLWANRERLRDLDVFEVLTKNDKDYLATHVAHRLDLRGPAVTVQTACSTSLVAVHLAAQSLLAGECDLALAGGVSVHVPQTAGYLHREGGIHSPDGHCRVFDAGARGTVPGSGAGVVVLRRLADALAAGDTIRAVLLGSALNNDGALKAGFTAPSIEGQAAVVEEAQLVAGVDPDSIGYVEAHGTGTLLGDPIEIAALTQAFRRRTARRGFCAIGSVKTNIGHLDAAAGVAGLIKTVLALERKELPPSLHFATPNPRLRLDETPFQVNTEFRPWPAGPQPRRAGVSSFGFGGTNVHVVLQEADGRQPAAAPAARRWQLLPLSARSATALETATDNLAATLGHADAAAALDTANHLPPSRIRAAAMPLADVAYTLQVGRKPFAHRRAVVCRDAAEARAALAARDTRRVLTGERALAAGAEPSVVFLFPGQGTQRVGMAAELYRDEPVFRDVVAECAEALAPLLDLDLRSAIWPAPEDAAAATARLERTALAQPALFVVELALARLLMSWGVRPAAMLGHSIGEWVAACLAGVFTLPDALALVAARGRLMEALPEGSMLAVPLPEARLRPLLDGELALAAVNAPAACVVSGPPAAVAGLAAELEAEGVASRPLRTSHAFHSPMMEPAVDAFAAAVRGVERRPPRIPFVSNVTGRLIQPAEATDPAYWARHLRQTVRFADGLAALDELRHPVLLEVGPGRVLSALAGRQEGAQAAVAVPTEGDWPALLHAIGRLWLEGGSLDWDAFHGGPRRRVPLPTYPFERRRYWIDAPRTESVRDGSGMTAGSSRESEALALLERLDDEVAQRLPVEPLFAEPDLARELDALCAAYAFRYLEQSFGDVTLGAEHPITELAARLGIVPAFEKLFSYLLDVLAEDGAIERRGGSVVFRRPPAIMELAAATADFALRHPDAEPLLRLLGHAFAHYPEALSGRLPSVAVLHSPEGAHLVAEAQAALARRWTGVQSMALAAEILTRVADAGPRPLRILEVGAGRGVLTAELVGALAGRDVAYHFTDLGASFVTAARERAAQLGAAAFMRFGTLDIARDGESQGYAPGSFDVIAGLDVVHATADVVATLRHLARLLAPGGLLLLVEATRPTRWANLVWGLEKGWWAFDDGLRTSSPLIDAGTWERALAAAGFTPAVALPRDAARRASADAALLVAPRGGGEDGAALVRFVVGETLSLGMTGEENAPSRAVVADELRQAVTAGAAAPPMARQGGSHLRPPLAYPYLAPRDGVERTVAEVWGRFLGVDAIGVDDDFHELGGDSLLMTQIASALRDRLGVELPLQPLFEVTTVAGAAELIRRLGPHASTPAATAADAPAAPPLRIPHDPDLREAPLSFAQQRLWFLSELEPGNPVYNVPVALRLRGPLDAGAMRRAFAQVVRRHAVLRTTFLAAGGDPRQVVHAPAGWDLPIEDVSEGDLAARAVAEGERPFDLGRGPLMRTALFRLAPDDHVLLVTMHHVVTDGWSLAVLLREIGALYGAFRDGRPSPLPELPIQYADFAVWQRRRLAGPALDAELAWWRTQLAGAPAVELPADHPRPAVLEYAGASLPVALPAELTAAAARLAREQGATPFMVLLAAFDALLARLTGEHDLAVGTVVANRLQAEVEPLVGCFVNTPVLRADLAGDPTGLEVIRRVRQVAHAAYAHQELPFEKLVEELAVVRDPSRTPLFSLLFVLQNTPDADARLPGLALERLPISARTARYDLTVSLAERDGAIAGVFEYRTALFAEATIRRLAARFATALAGLVAEPERRLSELPLLTTAEEAQLAAWNATEAGFAVAPIHRLFAAQAAATPDAVALVAEDRRVSYRELDRWADRLAEHLREHGVGPESTVGICIERSCELVAGLLGILAAGGAYVPLEPGHPPERLAAMARDAELSCVVTTRGCATRLAGAAEVFVEEALAWTTPDRHPERSARATSRASSEDAPNFFTGFERNEGSGWGKAPEAGAQLDHLAYVIYTSGSTGAPKGAMNTHRAVANRLLWMQAAYALGSSDRVLQKTPYGFDVSVWELFWPLVTGARMVLARPEGHRDARYLAQLAAAEGVTTMHFVPSMLRVFLEAVTAEDIAGLAHLRRVFASGEELPRDLCERFHAALPHVELHNLYGPTEAAVDVSAWPCRPGDHGPVPIGRPIANVRLHVLDAALHSLPLGATGELYIAGVAVGRGYLGRPDLTAERFLPDPLSPEPGARMYRTGDLARRRPDGALEFLGRRDGQVKVRGFRIELGEVEAELRRLPRVADAAAAAWPDGSGSSRIVAYVVPAHTGNYAAPHPDPSPTLGMTSRAGDDAPTSPTLHAEALRSALAERLPDFMVPSLFVPLERLPLSPNGKLDRRALPAPSLEAARPGAGAAPRGPVEELVAETFRSVLGLARAGAHESFFDLGGHSLLAAQVVARLRSALGVELPLRAVFEAPTVAGLAERALRAAGGGEPPPPIAPQPAGGASVLSLAQQRLYLLDRLAPGDPAYNIPFGLRLRGALDAGALRGALAEVVRRHEVLRSRFVSDGGEPRVVVEPANGFELPLTEAAGGGDADLQQLLRAEAHAPFDLGAGPLFRARLLRLAEDDHLLLATAHHIVFDGWSLGVLTRELGALYPALAAGRPAPLGELPIQYAAYARWQRERLAGPALERELEFWRRRLGGAAPLVLPADRPRPAARSQAGEWLPFRVPAEVAARLHALCRREGATLFMVLLAAYQALLHALSGQRDVAIGTPVAGRVRPETEPLIGVFINTLVLRGEVSEHLAFRDLLARARDTALAALAHQEVPFERIVEALGLPRDGARTPLLAAMLTLHNTPLDGLELPGLALSPVATGTDTSKLDLTLNVVEDGDGLAGVVEYATDLFDRATVAGLARRFALLLEAAAARPEATVGALLETAAREERRRDLSWMEEQRTRGIRRRAQTESDPEVTA